MDTSIEVFQDLRLDCRDTPDASLGVFLLPHEQPPWRHAREAEDAMAGTGGAATDQYSVFERRAWEGVPAARVVLRQDGRRYEVANIVPTECNSLGETGYNDVLNDFVARVARPAKDRGVSVSLTKRRQTMTDWTSKEAADALHLFSVTANKATGAHHPTDAQRWRRFLIADHRALGNLSSYNLQRWLVEVERWPEEEAQELINDRDKALELLDHYDHDHSV